LELNSGLSWAQVKSPISRKEREKWGTQPFWAEKKNSLDDLSNSCRPFDYVVKAGQPARRNAVTGKRLARSKEEKNAQKD
jgi:hypothetical protein